MTQSLKKKKRVENVVSCVFGAVIGRGCCGIPAFKATLINETNPNG